MYSLWRVLRLEAHAKSHNEHELLELLISVIEELGVKLSQILSLMTDNTSA